MGQGGGGVCTPLDPSQRHKHGFIEGFSSPSRHKAVTKRHKPSQKGRALQVTATNKELADKELADKAVRAPSVAG